MALSNLAVRSISNANGVVTSFPIPADFILGEVSSVIKVYEISPTTGKILTTYVESTDFDFDPPEDVVTGVVPTNVVFLSAPANGKKIMVQREMPLTQVVGYLNNSGFLAQDHEKSVDRIVMMIQQLALERGFIFNPLDSDIDGVLPSMADNAGRCLVINDDEDGFEWGPTVADLDAAIAAAEAAQAAAETAQAGAEAAESDAEAAVADAQAAVTDAEAAQAAAEAAQAAAEAAQAAAEAAALAASNALPTITGSRASPVSFAGAATLTPAGVAREKIYLKSSSGAASLGAIADGTADGQELTLVFCSDTDVLTVPHGINTKLNGNCVGSADVTLRLSWDLADWVEVGRNS